MSIHYFISLPLANGREDKQIDLAFFSLKGREGKEIILKGKEGEGRNPLG